MNKKIILTLIAVVAAITASAQGRMDLRINEVMVQNDSNYVDQYDHRAGWIEIFNASHGTNGIEKMFITTLKPDFIQDYFKAEEQKSNKKRNQLLQELRDSRPSEIFEIPRGDVATKVKPRSHVVFFADGNIEAGTFHLPFTMNPGQENYIALYDVNGDLVDEVTVPATLPTNRLLVAARTLSTCTEVTILKASYGKCATALQKLRLSLLPSSTLAPSTITLTCLRRMTHRVFCSLSCRWV